MNSGPTRPQASAKTRKPAGNVASIAPCAGWDISCASASRSLLRIRYRGVRIAAKTDASTRKATDAQVRAAAGVVCGLTHSRSTRASPDWYIATDSAAAVAASRAWAATNSAVRLVIAGSTASQNVSASAAEVAKVIGKRDDAYSIAEEVVLDLNLLLGPPHFVGLCMSQLARYVVGVGFARGTLKTATAMDHNRIQKKDQFKLGVEAVPWRPPTST